MPEDTFDFQNEWEAYDKAQEPTPEAPKREFNNPLDEKWHGLMNADKPECSECVVEEESLAPAVTAQPSTSQPGRATGSAGTDHTRLTDAIRRAADVDGESPDDEDEIAAYLSEELDIEPQKLKNLGLSLGNISARLAK